MQHDSLARFLMRGIFFPDTSPHDKLTDEVIFCKQKAAKSSVAVPIFLALLVSEWLCVVHASTCIDDLHGSFLLIGLTPEISVLQLSFMAQNGDIICHSLIRW